MTLTLLIVSLVCQGTILGLFAYYVSKTKAGTEEDLHWTGPLAEVERRIEQIELKWIATRDELIERAEVGSETWRKIRQRDAARKRREESQEELEFDEGPEVEELQPVHADGGDPRGMPYVSGHVGSDPDAPWRQFARSMAQQIAGGGGN